MSAVPSERRLQFLPGLIFLVLIVACRTPGADMREAKEKFFSGDYDNCIAFARDALRDNPRDEEWAILLTRALFETGKYPEALKAISPFQASYSESIQWRWVAYEVFRSNGDTNGAQRMVAEIVQMISRDPRRYRTPEDLVVAGRAILLSEADPKRVLDALYDTAKRADPKLRDVYLAAGELALDKHDYARASREFQAGLRQIPDDPDLHYGMARAYAESDQALMMASLEAALTRNSNHVNSLLLLADHSIDAEDYSQAEKLLDHAQRVNPWHPDSWAYRAVLAHLRNQPDAEKSARENALKFWSTNPRVDHLIGTKLSRKYRFTEGAASQRQALKFDPDYLPAKSQLAQDLLRLGDEAGWKLAEEVQQKDNYDVAAFNLTTLQDAMEKFTTLSTRDFRVRMSAHEAALYGTAVLELLERARTNLGAKYGFQVKSPTIVEIFPEQKDFAVRTFGMPGNPGYLGVCFGSVITANSPASQGGNPVNWQSVLWHEFCHVVTLQMTRNKMPRWLSEGISVYEERQANPAWGERMNPQYREMILTGELTPISKLSGAFLAPPSPMHLQFAYYESSLVVEFIIQRFGISPLKAILRDLGDGAEINATIEKHTVPMTRLEDDFAAFAREQAEKLAPGLDWQTPEFAGRGGRRGGPRSPIPLPEGADTNQISIVDLFSGGGNPAEMWEAWAKDRPTNFYVMTRKADQLLENKQWAEAKPILQKLVELYPGFTGAESAYRKLAATHRGLGETNEERQVLARFAERDDASLDAYLRLMELSAAAKDWTAVALNAERYLAVNPLVAPPYRFLAEASGHVGNNASAIEAYRALVQLGPADPADVHYRLADALYRAKEPEARRHVLMALEEAPRYRDALQLLLKIDQELPKPKASDPASETKAPARPRFSFE